MYQNRDDSPIILASVLKYQLAYTRPGCSIIKVTESDAFSTWCVSYRPVKCVLHMFSVGRCSSAELIQIKRHRKTDYGSSGNKSASAVPCNRTTYRTVEKCPTTGSRWGKKKKKKQQNKTKQKNENVIF